MNGKLNPSQNTNIDTKTDLENKCHVSTGQARTLRANKAPWNVFICASEPHSSLFVESSTFPLLSAACSELLSKCQSVFFAPHRFCNTTSSSNLATKYVCPGVTFLSLWVPHSSSSSSQVFYSLIIIYSVILWGFYRPDRQIMGVVSTLQLRAVIHTNFFLHNHRHWQSPLILLITTILSSKPSSSERAHCTH